MKTFTYTIRVVAQDADASPKEIQDKILEAIQGDNTLNILLDNKHTKVSNKGSK